MPKPELTPHEEYTVAQVKALLKQWPKSLVLELDEDNGTVIVYRRDRECPRCAASEVASFRKPSIFL